MSYVMGQIVVAGGSTVPLFRVPSGLCNVTFWNNTPAATIYVGSTTAVTAANGLICHSIPTNFYTYVSSGGAQFYGTVATGPATISYMVVTDQLYTSFPCIFEGIVDIIDSWLNSASPHRGVAKSSLCRTERPKTLS